MKKGEPGKTPPPKYGDRATYGAVFRQVREALGLTQTEMGDRVGRSTPAIRSYERNVFNPPPEVIAKAEGMARAAGLVDLANALIGAKPTDRSYLATTTLEAHQIDTFRRFVANAPADVVATMLTVLRELAARYGSDANGANGTDDAGES